MDRRAYIGRPAPSGRKVGDVVFAATNPDPARFVAADGSWLSIASRPALLAAALSLKQRQNVASDAQLISGVSNVCWHNVSPGKPGELLASADARAARLFLSADGGQTWTAKTALTAAQTLSPLGWSGGPWSEIGSSAYTYDAVSDRYLCVICLNISANGSTSGSLVCQLWQSTDLTAWTYVRELEREASGTGANVNNVRVTFQRNAAGDLIVGTGLRAWRCPAGQPANVSGNWVATLAKSASGWNVVTYVNGMFFACTGAAAFYTSPDGVAWTARAASQGNPSRCSGYSATAGYIFTTAGWNNSLTETTPNSWWYKTTDFANFTRLGFPSDGSAYNVSGVIGLDDGSLLAAVSDMSRATPLYIRSVDGGATWATGTPRLPTPFGGASAHFEKIDGKFYHWGLASALWLLDATPVIEVQAPTAAPYVDAQGATLNPYMKAA